MLALALASLFALSGVAGAAAATRFAAPGGTGSTPCAEQANPCSLFDAASLAASQPAGPGDEVILAPGTYTDTAGDLGGQDQILLDREVSLHGEAGKPRPVIVLEHGVLPALSVAFEDAVSHLEIDSAVAPSLIAIHGGTVDDLIARSSRRGGGIVCALTAGTLRDSACLSSGSRGVALGLEAVGTQPDFQEVAFLRNVTAVATGSESAGMKFQVSGTGASRPIFAVNGVAVIARGTANDVVARGLSLVPGTPGTGADVEVDLDHSDYANVLTQNDGGGGIVVVTDPNTEDNVTAPPLLAADGFHELRGSPTVDAGDTDLLSGQHDIDGQNRAIGFGPTVDIGADELGNGTTTDVSCSPGPLKTGEAFACTATVTNNTGFAGPDGEMSLATDGQGRFEGTPCALAEIPTTSASNCQFEYRPTRVGSGLHRLTVSYPGDATDDPSMGTASVAVAGTVVRFAAPGGTGAAPCSDPRIPCSLFTAASKNAGTSKAEAGDEVVLAPGTYTDAAGDLGPDQVVEMEEGIDLHGEAGRPLPVISIDANRSGGLRASPGSSVSDLKVRSAVAEFPFTFDRTAVERVVATDSAAEGTPCFGFGGSVRNTACLSSGAMSAGMGALVGGDEFIPTLRNVTAVATGAGSVGLILGAPAAAGTLAIEPKAVIAEGTEADVQAFTPLLGTNLSVDFDHSDFDTTKLALEGRGVASITEPGTGANITAVPRLAADGIHELPDSRTVDAGAIDVLSGSSDIDGEARVLGPAADIGADELAPQSPGRPTVPVTVPTRAPNTSLKKKPRRKTAQRRARFSFVADQAGSTFECRLDRRPYRRCRSPFRASVKPGHHAFAVRAVNAEGMRDPTPVAFHWKVFARLSPQSSAAIASATQAESWRCTSTLARRSVRPRSGRCRRRARPGARRGTRGGGGGGRRGPPPWRRRRRAGCPAAPRTRRRPAPSAWGRKWKMPPPPLSMTTMRTGVETSRRAARPPMSWSRPRSPVTIVVGRPLAWAAPIPEEIRPSIPLAPRLQRKSASVSLGAEEGLLVADRHARGGVDEVAVAVGAAEGEVQGGLGDRARRRQLRLERRRGPPRSAASQRSGAASLPRPPAAPPSRRPARSGRRAGSPPRGCVGSFQPPQGSTTIWSAPLAASQARSGLLVGISPKRRTSSGTTERAKRSSRSSRS